MNKAECWFRFSASTTCRLSGIQLTDGTPAPANALPKIWRALKRAATADPETAAAKLSAVFPAKPGQQNLAVEWEATVEAERSRRP